MEFDTSANEMPSFGHTCGKNIIPSMEICEVENRVEDER